MSRPRTELTAYAGLASSILAVALVLGAPTPWLGLVGALLLACVPAGAAVMCWIDAGEARGAGRADPGCEPDRRGAGERDHDLAGRLAAARAARSGGRGRDLVRAAFAGRA